MRRRQAGILCASVFLLAAIAARADGASIDLHLSLALDAGNPDQTVISGTITNSGRVPAYEVYAQLWPDDSRRRLGELQPGGELQVSWTIPEQRWRDDLRQIAAMRVRYRDGLEHWADAVV